MVCIPLMTVLMSCLDILQPSALPLGIQSIVPLGGGAPQVVFPCGSQPGSREREICVICGTINRSYAFGEHLLVVPFSQLS